MPFLGAVFVAFSALLIFASISATDGDPTMPGPFGDTQEYDSIALNLVRGRGYGIDYTDPEFRKPYESHNDEGEYATLLSWNTPYQPSTYRPPVLPVALAVTYAIFGRNFLAWRIIESLLTAFGIAIVCSVAWRAFGSRVALLTAGVAFVSHSFIRYVSNEGMMSEPLAMVGAAFLLWTLARFSETRAIRDAALAGIAFAVLVLTRGFFVLWFPFLPFFVWYIGKSRRAALVCLALAAGIPTPWWIRNCVVTRSFMPLGAPIQGAAHAAYSDLAVLHRGVWWRPIRRQAETTYVRDLGYACTGCDDVQLAKYQKRGSHVWLANHVSLVPKLMYWKVSNTIIFADEAGLIAPVFCLALAAPLVLSRRRAAVNTTVAMACVGYVVLTFAVISITWSMGWRFMVPVEPELIVLVAVPLTAALFGDEAIFAEPA
jgi:4-amino-4-deoxy-L-arabinose transferase-like glycosyltransferase